MNSIRRAYRTFRHACHDVKKTVSNSSAIRTTEVALRQIGNNRTTAILATGLLVTPIAAIISPVAAPVVALTVGVAALGASQSPGKKSLKAAATSSINNISRAHGASVANSSNILNGERQKIHQVGKILESAQKSASKCSQEQKNIAERSQDTERKLREANEKTDLFNTNQNLREQANKLANIIDDLCNEIITTFGNSYDDEQSKLLISLAEKYHEKAVPKDIGPSNTNTGPSATNKSEELKEELTKIEELRLEIQKKDGIIRELKAKLNELSEILGLPTCKRDPQPLRERK